MSNEMIERVARVLNPQVFDPEVLRVYGDLWANDDHDKAIRQARAAIAVMRNPTQTMKTRGFYRARFANGATIEDAGNVLQAMIDECLK